MEYRIQKLKEYYDKKWVSENIYNYVNCLLPYLSNSLPDIYPIPIDDEGNYDGRIDMYWDNRKINATIGDNYILFFNESKVIDVELNLSSENIDKNIKIFMKYIK
jgi:hypothetical protein